MYSSHRTGFSLVEVTIALGIAAFCLIAIFALLPVGLRSNLESSEETVSTGILSLVVSDLVSSPATSPPGRAATTEQFSIPIPANPVTTQPAVTSLFFSDAGYDGTSLAASSRYKVEVTFLTNSGVKSATMAKVKASWPASAPHPVGKIETLVALDRN